MQNSICILLWIGGLCQTNRNGNRHHEFIHCMIQIYKLYIELKSLWRIYYLFELNLSYNLYYVK